MSDTGVRIALLARAGVARDQLHRALSDAGAQIVAEGDPAELDPSQVAGYAPTCFLVSLEPAIESSLGRFDELLSAPGVEVMFDDAEVTGKLEGWDLNRWARHVASKLLGAEGLPPAPAGSPEPLEAEVTLKPGAPPTPAELMDHARLEDYTADTSALADSVPVSHSFSTSPETTPGDAIELEMEALDFTEMGEIPSWPQESGGPGAPSADDDQTLGESISFSSFGQDSAEQELGDLDADVAELAAQLEAFEKSDQRSAPAAADFADAPGVRKPAVPARNDTPTAEMPAFVQTDTAPSPASRAAAASFDFSNLTLAPVENEIAAAPPPRFAPAAPSAPSLGLHLEGDAEPIAASAPAGLAAVLVLAGLGGPDAVRQLLSSLPERLPLPVLLYQHLEVGKHERLVEQLAKISRLPVLLAQAGAAPEAGKVTLLPAGMTAVARAGALSFTQGPLSDLIAALPATQSMIVVLSGAEIALVPQIMTVKQAGGMVFAQDPKLCFDGAAAEAMKAQGAPVFPALGLAQQIAGRWPS
ncbi:MAG: chemotaxis protein CheB [Arenimonas sp.]